MSGQSRWWAIPGALLVMTAVLALGNKQGVQRNATSGPLPAASQQLPPAVAADVNLPETVMVRDASGQRRPLALAVAAATEALRLVLPNRFAGQRVDVKLWRRIDDQREAEPWITMRPLVRADATLPMAGIVPGRYDLEVVFGDESPLVLQNVLAPSEASFRAATPVR